VGSGAGAWKRNGFYLWGSEGETEEIGEGGGALWCFFFGKGAAFGRRRKGFLGLGKRSMLV
jgi:hypothetical protein